jgi:Protein of unknown function (DUF992)
MSIKLTVRAAFAAALFGLASIATTPARADVAVGMLTCRSPQISNYIIASAHVYDCVFTPAAGSRQYYQATVYRVGAEVGTSSNTGLAWAVFALTAPVGPGQLAGGYGGVSAGAAVGIGGRANALVGGLPNAFTLQPVSLEGETGLNAVATVTGLVLRPVVVRHRRHRR